MNIDNEEPRYVISVAARMVGVQVHTLRYYERVDIIEPSRSSGNTRLYSESDIALLRRMKTLMEAEKILIEQDMGLIPIYHYVRNNMIDLSKWGGWTKNLMDYHPPQFIYKK